MNNKKISSLLIAGAMTFLTTSCGKDPVPSEPSKDVMKGEVQTYISQLVDDDAEISYFSIEDAQLDDSSYTADCICTYQNDTTKYVEMFELTYSLRENEWELDKISIDKDYEGRSETLLEKNSSPDEESTTNEDSTDSDEVKTDDKAEQDNSSENTAVEMSDELSDFTFILDGKTYQLPMDYSQLVSDGWTISSSGKYETDVLNANSYMDIKMSKSGNSIYAYIINMSGNAKQLSDCKIGGIEVQMSSISSADFFSMANGVNLSMNIEQIQEALGATSEMNTYDDYSTLKYSFDKYSYVSFACYNSETKYNSINIKNYVSDESDITETSTEVPEYLSTYKAPEELGNNALSGNIEFGGKLYTLPAPISEFLDDGWKIVSKSGDIGSGNKDSIRVERDGVKIYLNICNYSDYQTIPENCAVYGLSVYDEDNISVVLPNDMSVGKSKEEVEAWINEDYSYNKGSSSYSYYNSDYKLGYSIYIHVDIETEKVSNMNIKFEKWNYE